MGGFGPDGYDARTIDELFQTYLDSIDQEYGSDLESYEGAFNRSLFLAFARAVAANQEQDLEDLYDSLFIATAAGDELTQLCAERLDVQRQEPVRATGVVEWTRASTGNEQTIPSGTLVATQSPESITFETTEPATFGSAATTVQQNVRAVEGGTIGNVGADRIIEMPSPPANVTGVTNPQPTGDPQFDLTGGDPQTLGQDRETDAELRDRALSPGSIDGAATVGAVAEAVRGLEERPSLTIYTNRRLTDNANGNGLPKLSAEVVIYRRGATAQTVGETIHEQISIGERLVNGINGTANSYTVTDDVLGQDRTIKWSEPTPTALEITVDVVTEAGYAGDVEVERAIAEYIGGTDPDGGAVPGLDVGEDVVVDELESRITDLDGVVGVATVTIDDNSDGTDDTTTRGDGLQAYVVATDEVVEVDATSDITVN
jgi:hypothetical protein